MPRLPIHLRLRFFLERMIDRLEKTWGKLAYPFEWLLGLVLHRTLVERETADDGPRLSDRVSYFFGYVWFQIIRLCGRIWDIVIWPFERVFMFFTFYLFRAIEALHEADSYSGWIIYMLGWPVRAMGRLRDRWARREISAENPGEATRSVYLAQATSWRVVRSVIESNDWISLDYPVWIITRLSYPIWAPVLAIVRFVSAYAGTRHPWHLLLGAPALLMLVGILTAATASLWSGEAGLGVTYRAAYRKAIDENNPELTSLFQRKLSQLGLGSPDIEYEKALKLAERGELDNAFAQFTALADREDGGDWRAHHWLAKQYVQQLAGAEGTVPHELTAAEAATQLERHLTRLEDILAGSQELEMIQAVIAEARGDYRQSAVKLTRLADQYFAYARVRFKSALRSGDAKLIRDAGTQLITHFQQRQTNGEEFTRADFQLWLGTIEASRPDDLARNSELKRVIGLWQKRRPNDESIVPMVKALRRRELELSLAAEQADPYRLSDLIRTVVQEIEDGRQRQSALLNLYKRRANKPIVDEAFFTLEKDDDTPAMILETLGYAHAMAGEWRRAEACLERVTQLKPNSAIAWNNYSWCIAHLPNPRLREALQIIEKALAMEPDSHRFRETRGQIYARLEEWDLAIADLEHALNGLPDSTATRESLIRAYEATSQDSLAESHRRQL